MLHFYLLIKNTMQELRLETFINKQKWLKFGMHIDAPAKCIDISVTRNVTRKIFMPHKWLEIRGFEEL